MKPVRMTFLREWIAVAAFFGAGCGLDPVVVNNAHNGRSVEVVSGQELQILLQTIGPGQYGEPSISTGAVRFVGMSLPEAQNPGGPRQLYTFSAVRVGFATITIVHVGDVSGQTSPTFTLLVTVKS